MKKYRLVLWLVLSCGWLQAAENHADARGIITKKSAYSVPQTLDRLEAALKQKGVAVMLRVAHHNAAAQVGVALRPTELIIFGNPKLGSHMFTSQQSAGLDLPLKALAWQDEAGQVWLSYNAPAYIAERHGIADRQKIVSKMTAVLDALTNIASKP
jgi:uncharacterized protein (DUF302 family)